MEIDTLEFTCSSAYKMLGVVLGSQFSPYQALEPGTTLKNKLISQILRLFECKNVLQKHLPFEDFSML